MVISDVQMAENLLHLIISVGQMTGNRKRFVISDVEITETDCKVSEYYLS